MTKAKGTALAEVEDAGAVTSLLDLAIREKVPVEVLERLVALKERVDERDARAEYLAAMAAFQRECPEIPKDKTAQIITKKGGKYNYSYSPLETIVRTIQPHLERNGLAFRWTTERSERDGELNVVCISYHVGGHEERATFPVPTDTEAYMSGAQKNGAALTYGRRQSLVAVFGLVTADDDPDAPGGDEPITPEQVKQLADKIVAVGAHHARFLAFMKVDKLDDIPASEFDRAMEALEKKGGKT